MQVKQETSLPLGLGLTACRGSTSSGPGCESTAVYRHRSMQRPEDILRKALATKKVQVKQETKRNI